MLRKYLLTCFIIVIFALSKCYAKSVGELDGLDWEQWSESMKTGYVVGFVHGTTSIISEIDSWRVTAFGIKKGVDLYMPKAARKYNKPTPEQSKKLPKETKETLEMEEAKRSFIYKNKEVSYDLLSMMHLYIDRDRDLSNFVVGQVLSGLNEFYSDFKNKRVPIEYAIMIVKMQLEGYSEEAIELAIKSWRSFKPLLDEMRQKGYLKEFESPEN